MRAKSQNAKAQRSLAACEQRHTSRQEPSPHRLNSSGGLVKVQAEARGPVIASASDEPEAAAAAVEDLRELHSSGLQVIWPRVPEQSAVPSGQSLIGVSAHGAHICTDAAGRCLLAGGQSLFEAAEEVVAELAELRCCGLRVTWPS